MVNEVHYTSIRRVLDNLTDHKLLKDVSLERVVRLTLRFIGLHGYPTLYEDKITDVDIHEFRGVLPCDIIRIIQVRDVKTGMCLRAMTDTFTPGMMPKPKDGPVPPPKEKEWYIPARRKYLDEPAFKTQGRVIYTSFPEGVVTISYQAIPVDEDGFPKVLDNETYLAALEAYIKVQVFTDRFDGGDVSSQVLQNAKADYNILSAELRGEMNTPSMSEMEAISRSMTALIPRMREFDNGFRNLGDREYIRKQG